jgi:hypothetical protein
MVSCKSLASKGGLVWMGGRSRGWLLPFLSQFERQGWYPRPAVDCQATTWNIFSFPNRRPSERRARRDPRKRTNDKLDGPQCPHLGAYLLSAFRFVSHSGERVATRIHVLRKWQRPSPPSRIVVALWLSVSMSAGTRGRRPLRWRPRLAAASGELSPGSTALVIASRTKTASASPTMRLRMLAPQSWVVRLTRKLLASKRPRSKIRR